MSPAEVVLLLTNRLATIATQRADAVQRGDLSRVVELDADAAGTLESIALLQG